MANYTPPASLTTSYPANTTSQAPSTSTLPPEINPSNLDTLPILTAILTRLQASTTPATNIAANTHPHTTSQAFPQSSLQSSSSPHVSQSQTLSAVTAVGSTFSPFPSGAPTSNNAAAHSKDAASLQTGGPLSTKDIPAETDELRARLKRARAMVAALPDMRRGVEEQEVEIRELEARIEEQRGVLRSLKAVGAGIEGMET